MKSHFLFLIIILLFVQTYICHGEGGPGMTRTTSDKTSELHQPKQKISHGDKLRPSNPTDSSMEDINRRIQNLEDEIRRLIAAIQVLSDNKALSSKQDPMKQMQKVAADCTVRVKIDRAGKLLGIKKGSLHGQEFSGSGFITIPASVIPSSSSLLPGLSKICTPLVTKALDDVEFYRNYYGKEKIELVNRPDVCVCTVPGLGLIELLARYDKVFPRGDESNPTFLVTEFVLW